MMQIKKTIRHLRAGDNTPPDFQDSLSAEIVRKMTNDDTTAVTYPSIIDTTDILPLIPEKSISEFRKAQPLAFRISLDTVINDERGVFVGKRMSLGKSHIQWLDSNKVTSARITDSRIRLTHGVRVGMTRQEVQQKLNITPFKADTLVIETGYMLNHCTFFFWQGRLNTVCLEEMPD
jgi:hypothetical protein